MAIKKNISTTMKEGLEAMAKKTVDVNFEIDSSLMRVDTAFRKCFHEAGPSCRRDLRGDCCL